MNDKQRRRSERLSRISAFMAEHAADFPPTTKGGQAAARLDTILAESGEIEAARVSKKSEKQQATLGRREQRELLYDRLTAIRDTSEAVGLDHPEVKGLFQWSRSGMSDQTLLATARAFLSDALPQKALFIEYNMAADFLDKLQASIDSFDQHINRQTSVTGSGVAATAALEDTLKRGEAEAERLDAAVRNKYPDAPSRMAAWESASRLERAARAAADKKADGAPPAP